MTIREFHTAFERAAPSALAWKSDNVGLLLGKNDARITNILVALDLTMDVAREAKKIKANLILTHHPFLFHPLRKVTPSSRSGALTLFLAEEKMNIYAAHTNLDSVAWGVNGELAKALGLSDTRILAPMKDLLSAIVVFVPRTHADAVADAMFDAGAGEFAKYDRCGFRAEGIGSFRGKDGAKPFLGKPGTLEHAEEVRLEMIAEQFKLPAILAAMKKVHPYEEVAFDVLPLLNQHEEYGLGMIGRLKEPLSATEFLSRVKKRLKADHVRFTGPTKRKIERVAVCGGSGSEFIGDAIAAGADAMVTADLKFHTFQDHENDLLLVDAGHWETEHVVLPALAEKVREIGNSFRFSGKVFVTTTNTNPVHTF